MAAVLFVQRRLPFKLVILKRKAAKAVRGPLVRAWCCLLGGIVLAAVGFQSCGAVYMSDLARDGLGRAVQGLRGAVSLLAFFLGLGLAAWGAVRIRVEDRSSGR